MKYFWLLLSLLWMPCVTASPELEEKINLTFSVNAPGTSPFLYFDEAANSYQGVVVDFFASFEDKEAFNVVYLDTSRARYENTVINASADLFVSAKAWLKDTGSFIFSNTLVTHDSHIYSTTKFTTDFLPAKFTKATVCTRYNFTYPALGSHFNNKDLIRINSSNQSTMTDMLIKSRCRFLIMGAEDARAEMFRPKYCMQAFFESPNVISSVDLVLVMHPALGIIQDTINRQLVKFIDSGQRNLSIKHHVGKKIFPKRTCSQR
jgi:polar amino acid transport system substrate-binding protein